MQSTPKDQWLDALDKYLCQIEELRLSVIYPDERAYQAFGTMPDGPAATSLLQALNAIEAARLHIKMAIHDIKENT